MDAKEYAIKNFEKYAHEIPEHIVDGFRDYLIHGIEPGSFCYAVLCNNLKEASSRADQVNRARLADIGQFMAWGMPSIAQGSEEKVNAWIAQGGLEGKAKAEIED